MRSATPWFRVRIGRFGRLVGTCGLLLLAGSVAAMLAERRASPLQPGLDVIVRELAAGRLLVAKRNLPDPNFTDTVVLLIEYSREGAAGIVINRPSGVPLSRALPGVEQVAGVAATTFIGGPVSQGAVLALSRSACGACPLVGRDVYLVNTPDALKARLAEGADERRLRVYVGYAGWGRGQLEAETRQGAWHVAEADARAVFDPKPESLWRRMIGRAEAVLASLVGPSHRWRARAVAAAGTHDSRAPMVAPKGPRGKSPCSPERQPYPRGPVV
jgi:putative transcriptional regulator